MSDIDFAILPASYKDLSVANVESNRQLLRDLWQSAEPQLDVDRGALSMLVLNPVAILLEVGRETFRTARKSSSFTALLADGSQAAAPMLDELARSYRVTRRSGSIASGRIRLFFSENVPRTIGLSTTFQANGMLFKVRNVETLFSSHEPPSTLPNTQNLREADNNGTRLFFADVTVYARTAGSAGNLVRGTELSLSQSAIPYFVRAVAMETFSGGENDESNDSLVQRMVLGVSAKVLSSRVNMRASLLEKFPDIRDSSVNVPLIDDANYLYKLMIDTNNGIKELRNFTKNTVREEYGLYDAYKQVTGLAEPSHPKLIQRQVRGLLKHVFGVGSSKFSMVQRNLLGTPTDMVGRAVIVPDPDLDMDSVGIPEEKAWEVYRPHLVHRLTKRGIPWAQAARFIEDRSPVAKEALLKEMEERPVIMDRAPVLHKWGIMAFKPRLVSGDSIHTNQFIMKAISGDHDGDQMNFHVPSSPEAVQEAFNILLPSKSLIQSSDLKSAQPRIISENAGGLYLASLPPDKKRKPRTFVSWSDAEKAYRRGDLAIDEPVVVLSSRALPHKN